MTLTGLHKAKPQSGESTACAAVSLERVDLVYRRYPQPRDALLEWLLRSQRHEKFYALRDLSFSLQPGTALGLVGDNGAGKSTLLRLLAGNLAPSSGTCLVNGRRAALLELGCGLNPEFSGIENARVGLALRGLSQQEISQVLPDVLSFAELGEFVQQPVKNYSSGMVVRLVFALAAVLEPDVLIVDEALSVGDQYFQKKSLDRMREILTGGATLVFCSHNLYQLREVCQQAIWLEQGKIRMLGEAQQVVDAYQDAVRARCGMAGTVKDRKDGVAKNRMSVKIGPQDDALHNLLPQLMAVELQGGGGCNVPESGAPKDIPHLQTGQRFVVSVQFDNAGVASHDIHVGVVIRRNDDVQCYGISTLHDAVKLHINTNGSSAVRFIIDSLPLLSGEYCLEVWLIDGSGMHVYDARERCCHFRVQQVSQTQGVGMSWLPHRWETGGVSAEADLNNAVGGPDATVDAGCGKKGGKKIAGAGSEAAAA